MIFIANALPMNGGSTFLVRLCEQLSRSGISVGVLVLFKAKSESEEVVSSLKAHAELYYLADFSLSFLELFFRSQLGIFLPVKFQLLNKFFKRHGGVVHVMGVFGLFFLVRMLNKGLEIHSFTLGVYHQNEFMFPDYHCFFSRLASNIFKNIDPRAVVFFNEFNALRYSQHFGNDYSVSSIIPIGIRMVEPFNKPNNFGSNVIVSVGNLVSFKTYNEHVIRCLPDLLRVRPDLKYLIYGEGQNVENLKALASELGVSASVNFCGSVDYSKFRQVVEDCFVFVGSGTAILEAAVLGVPAIVGIESTKRPLTYGFISDIEGLAYNEDSDRSKFSMFEKIEWLMEDSCNWRIASQECRRKSKQFSIAITAQFFRENKANVSFDSIISQFPTARVVLSMLLHAAMSRVFLSKPSFSKRRDAGTDV